MDDSAFMDVVVERVAERHRSKLPVGTSFVTGEAISGMEVFTVGYPLGWGPTMAFGRIGNTNTFLQTVNIERTTPGQKMSVKVRRIDADLTFHVVLGGG